MASKDSNGSDDSKERDPSHLPTPADENAARSRRLAHLYAASAFLDPRLRSEAVTSLATTSQRGAVSVATLAFSAPRARSPTAIDIRAVSSAGSIEMKEKKEATEDKKEDVQPESILRTSTFTLEEMLDYDTGGGGAGQTGLRLMGISAEEQRAIDKARARANISKLTPVQRQKARAAGALVKDALYGRSRAHSFDEDKLRIWDVVRGRRWMYLRILVAIGLLALALFESPALPGWEATHPTVELVELGIMVFFAADVALTVYCAGWANFLSVSNRRAVRVALISLIVLDAVISIITSGGSVRFTRPLRPLLLITLSEVLSDMSLLAVISARAAIPAMMMVTFLVVFFSLVGFYLFGGKDPIDVNYFGTIEASLRTMLVLATLSNYPDCQVAAFNESGFYAIFFVLFILLAIWFASNLILAQVYFVFSRFSKRLVAQKLRHVESCLDAAFDTLSEERGTGVLEADSVSALDFTSWLLLVSEVRPDLEYEVCALLFDALDANKDGVMSRDEFFDLCRYMSATIKLHDEFQFTDTLMNAWPCIKGPRDALRNVLKYSFRLARWRVNPSELVFDLLVVVNSVTLFVEVKQQKNFDTLNLIFLGAFGFEMLLKITAFGLIGYWRDGVRRLDGIITIASIVGELAVADTRSVSVLRIVRLLRLLGAVASFRTTLKTLGSVLSSESLGLLVLLFAAIYTFAALGMELFAGELTASLGPGASGYLTSGYVGVVTFDDITTSVCTVFALVNVNNWHLIAEAAAEATSEWAWVYFSALYVVAFLVLTSLVVSFLLDSFLWFQAQANIAGGVTSSDDEEEDQTHGESPEEALIRAARNDRALKSKRVKMESQHNLFVGMFGDAESQGRYHGVLFT